MTIFSDRGSTPLISTNYKTNVSHYGVGRFFMLQKNANFTFWIIGK